MPVYSPSSLSTFERCPRHYRYIYIEKLPREETVEAFMGTMVHEALRKLYQDLMLSKLNTLEEILDYYHSSWDKNWTDDVRIVKDYTPEDYRLTGAKCIAGYYHRYKPFNQSRTLALERKIRIKLGDYTLQGYVDRLAESSEGCYEIHDYKTSQSLPTMDQLTKDRQLALYQLGVENSWGPSKQTELIWHYLVHGKEIRLSLTQEELMTLKTQTLNLIHRLEKAVEEDCFPPREGELCPWCSYRRICPSRKHVTMVQEMPPGKHLQDPGVKLVNEYARLLEEKKRYLKKLDAELQELKQAIAAYAEREGLDIIMGSRVKLRVKKVLKTSYPSKKDNARRELDELLKKEGVWMDVSDLNTFTLTRMLDSGEWSRELVDKIRRFQRVEEDVRLHVSRLKS
jgi:putative RecB family exonuclease